MTELAVSIRNLSKCYKLGTIGRHTLVEEAQYWWHKIRGQDPRQYMNKIGYTATEARRVKAEMEGNPEFWALKDITFDVQPGEVVGIIGRNGAGKSTLLKILTRITEPTFGEAIINGRIASLLEVGTGFHPELTGRENIYMNGAILGMKKREIDLKLEEIVTFSELETFIDTPVKRYSSGMYVRLAFAVAAHLEPEILLIDEVLAVGDASFQEKCLGKMKDVTYKGRTILFVSHNMVAVKSLCNRGIYIKDGTIDFMGSSEKVVERYIADTLKISRHIDISQRKDRRGSGSVRVTKMDVSFDKDRGAWVIRIDYVSGTPTWSDAGLMVSIRRASGEVLTFLDSSCISSLPKSWPGKGTVDIQLTPELRFSPGDYLCNVACLSGKEIVDHVTDAFALQVSDVALFDWRRQPSGAGLFWIKQNWVIQSA